MDASFSRTVGALAALALLPMPALAQRMERGSFLRKPANGQQQLVKQVRSDPIVAARYARLFGVPTSRVTSYFQTLRLSTIPSTARYTVWHVDPDGTFETKRLLLKKGTQVYRDSTGRMVLKANCGNPMVASIPSEPVASNGRPGRLTEVVEEPASEPEVLATVPDVVTVVPPSTAEVTPVAPVAPVEPVAPVAPVTPGAPQTLASGGGGLNLGPLLAIPLIGGVIAAGGNGGGGGGTNPVPEPATMVAIAAGAGLVLRRRRR